MKWTRIPLAQFTSGYDAVIEFASSVIDQQVQRQPLMSISEIVSGPFSVPPRITPRNQPASGQPVVELPTVVATLSMTPTGPDHGLHTISSVAEVMGRDVALRITVLNTTSTGRQITALLTALGVPTQGPVSAWIPSVTQATLTLLLANISPGTHALSVQLFDVADPSVQTSLQGTLALTPQPTGTPYQISPIGVQDSPNLLHALGVESRVSASMIARATLTGPFTADLSLPAPANSVVIALAMSVDTVVIETHTLITSRPAGFDLRTGRLSEVPLSTEYRVDRRTVQAQAHLTLPILTSVDASTQAIDVYGDLAAATVSIATNDAQVQFAQSDLARQLEQAIRAHSAGTRFPLTPRISLLGALQAGQTIQEIQVSDVMVTVLPGSALAVGITLAGNTATKAVLTNFVGRDDYATVISGSVIKAIADFRWRIGDYPRVLSLTRPVPGAYKENSNTVDILIFTQIRQASNSVAAIKAAGPQTYGTSTGVFTFLMTDVAATVKNHPEDYLLMGGLGSFEVSRIVRKDNGQDVTAQVGGQYSIPTELQSACFHWPFSMSFVGPPSPAADANIESFLQSMRRGVSQHLSRPFAGVHTVSLSSRDANGIENILLSRGSITL